MVYTDVFKNWAKDRNDHIQWPNGSISVSILPKRHQRRKDHGWTSTGIIWMHVGSNVRICWSVLIRGRWIFQWRICSLGSCDNRRNDKEGIRCNEWINLYLIKVQTRISAKLSRPCGKDPYGKPEEISLWSSRNDQRWNWISKAY